MTTLKNTIKITMIVTEAVESLRVPVSKERVAECIAEWCAEFDEDNSYELVVGEIMCELTGMREYSMS